MMRFAPFAQVALRELRTGFRNPWAYSFLALFAIFMLILTLIHAQGYMDGYSGITGSMLNLMLYLLPLMTLMLGSFSLTGEKEDGSWELLSTYPLGTSSFIAGKYVGLSILLLTIIVFGFGIAGLVSSWAGGGFSIHTFMMLFVFAVSLASMFLAVSMVIGSLAVNRWQALVIVVTVWFFLVIAWAPLLIAILGWLPYVWIKPAVSVLTLLNPAELSRIFAVIALGGGAVLGPEYYDWVKWVSRPTGSVAYVIFVLLWIGLAVGLADLLWERRRARD